MKPPSTSPQTLDYQDLWQYFENRGSELKGTMLQLETLLIGFSAALLGFGIDKAIAFDKSIAIKSPALLLVLGIIGLVIAVFSEMVIEEFGEHINRNFDRADLARKRDRTLDQILDETRDSSALKKLPGICIRVRMVTRAFGAVFALGSLCGLIKLVASVS